MNIPKIINKIYKRWLNNPHLILSESDLKCQIYSELIKNKTTSIRTEWTCTGGRPDIIIHSSQDLKDTRNEKGKLDGWGLKNCNTIIELKYFYYVGSNGDKQKDLKKDIKKLKKYRNEYENAKLYCICFDLFDDSHPKLSHNNFKKLNPNGIKLIYKARKFE